MNKLILISGLLFITTISYAFKNEANPKTIVTENNECIVKGLFYTVQIGVFSQPVSEDKFPDVSLPLYCVKRADGKYAYFTGLFDSRFDAMLKRYDVVSTGMYDAYVAVYFNGVQISMSQADELIAKHDTSILYNAMVSENLTERKE